MPDFLSKVRSALPIGISFVSWDKTTLAISGKNWGFNTLSDWRIISQGSVLLGSLDADAMEVKSRLIKLQVTSIDWQSTRLCIDPVFGLSNGNALEIFSHDLNESWVLNIEDLNTFVQ